MAYVRVSHGGMGVGLEECPPHYIREACHSQH